MATLAMSFSCVPDRILDLGISPRAQSTFHALVSHRNRRTGLCNPKQKTLAERLRCPLRTIQRAFAELRSAGMILAHRTITGNRYDITTPDKWQPPSLAGAQPPSLAGGNRQMWRVEAGASLYEPDVFQPDEKNDAAAALVTTVAEAAAAASIFVENEPEKPTHPAPGGSGSLNENFPGHIAETEKGNFRKNFPGENFPAQEAAAAVAAELMAVHPEPGNAPKAVAAVAALVASKPGEGAATLEAVRASHASWRLRWADYAPGRFIPQLWRWIADGDWRNVPVERKGVKSETWIEKRAREQKANTTRKPTGLMPNWVRGTSCAVTWGRKKWRSGVPGSKQKLLPDSAYEKQIERMSGLPKFPVLPGAKQELRHALRRISETDLNFLHRLISDVMDTHTSCPTPASLFQMAGQKRQRAAEVAYSVKALPDCERCGGTGFISITRHVKIAGLGEYDADFAERCHCGH